MSQAHHHRPTLKQNNKTFKSKHASKGSRKAAAKGRADAVSGRQPATNAALAGMKKARLNQNAQKRGFQQRSLKETAKLFSTSSGGGKVPRIVSIVSLLPSLSSERFLRDLLSALGLSAEEIANVQIVGQTSVVVHAPRFKTALHFNLIPSLQLYASLDAALVSDTVILLMSSVDEVQLEGEAVLRCLQGQAGGVHIVPCVQAPEGQLMDKNARSLVHKSLLSFTRYFFPNVDKIHSSDTPSDAVLLARALCESLPSVVQHPEGRSWLLAEGADSVSWEPSDASDAELGILRVTGTIRGGKMSANRLVHIPGYGDFQVAEIIAAQPLRAERGKSSPLLGQLSSPTSEADDLTANNIPDLMANEQTWPTEEEMQDAPVNQQEDSSRRRVKLVPKGTSAYQAAWIVDEDEDGDEDEDDDDSTSSLGESLPAEEAVLADQVFSDEELEEVELDEFADPAHNELSPEDEEAQYEEYLKERERSQRDDLAFPDEMDTPRHVSARVRFQRYRGLRSFRTSPWDPYENLPLEYGEIFQFESFSATQKRVELEARADGVQMGTRVTLVVRNVPRGVSESGFIVVHGLLRHEHKQTVLHFAVQRNTEYQDSVRAKDSLVLCVGPRRLVIRPLFSQHVRGGGKGANNVHKSDKFLRHGATTVVTTFGPACFGKQPCLLLREPDSGHSSVPDLVAMGSFLSADPTRIIAKRIILTGHPFKIHKKTATIRYMFFNREDVEYFKTVELHTKYGRTGHIREALGTHGYFKAHFDGPIQQMDTICMSLYKRQFPKKSEAFCPRLLPSNDHGMDVE